MWEEGVQCFDAHRNERFTLRAVLLWTIIDFFAYGNLCGCSVKGYKACPICEEETSSIRLPHGKKNAYMRHRKYLPSHHPYRRQKKAFDGNQKHGTPPIPLSGETIYNRLKDKTFPYGKMSSRRFNEDISNDYWKRISASYELAYWKKLHEKVLICRTLSDLKVPEGYSSNFRSLVSLENLTLSGLKSHDCHVLMQQLLPIAIRGVLPNNVRVAITRLCSFFNAI
ncbi:hypothetical protein IC582_003330 [Cucumis melo]